MSERFPPGCLINEEGQAAILSIEAREDERVKPLVIEAISKRALGCTNEFSVREAFLEAKAAYDDTAFRQENRPAIVERAKRLARRAGQTPDMMVSTEAPVPCRLEGLQLWFFNDQRLLPVWRMFEPLAIVQVREELHETELRESATPKATP